MGYVFDPAVLGECARRGIDLPLEEAFDRVTDAVAAHYSDHVHTGPRNWIYNNAGGAFGMLTLLHASLSEYLLLFGTDIGTSGHSGRYRTEVYDWLFAGEMWCFEGDRPERVVYRPGSQAYLGAHATKGYRLPERGWMLEYARGPIPTMLPFGLADGLLSTLDHRAVANTLLSYGSLCVKSLLRGKI